MKAITSRLIPAFAIVGCAVLAACYPVDESTPKRIADKPANKKTVTTPEQQKIQEERDRMKKEEEKKEEAKKEEEGNSSVKPDGDGGTVTPPKDEKKEGEKKDYAFANKVPGKDGFVFSPYNNKIVDVRDIPSGTLVQDPTYTGAGKGYFRVP